MPVEYFKFVSTLKIEQVVDPVPGQNSIFQKVGAYAEEFYAEFALDPVTIKAGKILPVFSLVTVGADGINSGDLAGNLDADESLGVQVALDLELAGHKQVLTGSFYTLDRSFLARSLFTGRPVPKLSDGGAGNSTGLSSVAVVLDGSFGADVGEIDEPGVAAYRLGMRFQRHGQQTEEQAADDIVPQNEFAALGAVLSTFDLGSAMLRLVGEASYTKNFEGDPVDAAIFTGIASIVDGPMTYSTTLSRQMNFVSNGADTSLTLAELAVEYKPETDVGLFNGKWSTGAAYTFANDEDNLNSHMISLRLNLEFGGTKQF